MRIISYNIQYEKFIRAVRKIFIYSTFSAVLLFICSLNATPQTIYDLNEINGDIRFIGFVEYGILNKFISLDIDNSNNMDIFVGGPSPDDIYGFLNITEFNPLNLYDLKNGQYDILIKGGSLGSTSIRLGYELIGCDITADSIEDLFTSDRAHDTVYCLFGSDSWHQGQTIDLTVEPADLTIRYDSIPSHDHMFGCSFSTADINQDGKQDIIIGSYSAQNTYGNHNGGVFVIYGSEKFIPPYEIDLNETQADITIYGETGGDSLGYDVSSGDVNGDGIEDIVIGAHDAPYQLDRHGRVYVIYGSAQFPDHHLIDLSIEEADLTIRGPHRDSLFGHSVASGDINGDGIDDICTGAPWEESVAYDAGAAFIIYGRDDFPAHHFIDLTIEQADISCYGESGNNHLGASVQSGDLDGNGIEECAIASAQSQEAANLRGITYILSGSTDYPACTDIRFSQTEPQLKIFGDDDEDLAYELNPISDLNGDGFDDLIIGAGGADRYEGQNFIRNCGEIYVILGHAPLDAPPRIMAGPGSMESNTTEARLYDPFYNDIYTHRFSPFLFNSYGATVAAGDLDGDGYDELLTGPGPGPSHPPLVIGMNEDGDRLFQFLAYSTRKYGVNVAAGDIDGDGLDEIITGPGPGNVFGPHVRGWRWTSGTPVSPIPQVSYLAYGTHRWGVNVSCGDIDGDGIDEIVTGAGPGSVFGPHVRAWNWDGAGPVTADPRVSYLAYGTNKYGVNVACGDIDADGFDEIITGPGPGEMFGAHVRGWNYDGDRLNAMEDINFLDFPGQPGGYGVQVACGDVDNDRVDEILTAPGPHSDNMPIVKTWNYDGVELIAMGSHSFYVFEPETFKAGARIAFGHVKQEPPYLE